MTRVIHRGNRKTYARGVKRRSVLAACCCSLLVTSVRADYRQKYVTVDPQKTKTVKRLAIVPFFFASSVSVDDPSYTGTNSEAFPTVNVIAAREDPLPLSNRRHDRRRESAQEKRL